MTSENEKNVALGKSLAVALLGNLARHRNPTPECPRLIRRLFVDDHLKPAAEFLDGVDLFFLLLLEQFSAPGKMSVIDPILLIDERVSTERSAREKTLQKKPPCHSAMLPRRPRRIHQRGTASHPFPIPRSPAQKPINIFVIRIGTVFRPYIATGNPHIG
jgi:hypothetical protein